MNIKKGFTHAGKFHADDVFSSALLKIIYPNIVIERGFDIPKDFDGIVFDIGGGEFDHHQENSRVRDNGCPYASFGLLWEKFGNSLIGDFAKNFDEKFVQPIDFDDNTGCGNDISDIISNFNPLWNEKKTPDIYNKCFNEAVLFAKLILKKKFDFIISNKEGFDFIKKAYKNSKNKIVILDRFIPWKQVLINTDSEFVIYPSDRGGYNAQVVPISSENKKARINFPKSWAGKTQYELFIISNIKTLKFCHNSRFLISTDTIEDAIKACEFAKYINDSVEKTGVM